MGKLPENVRLKISKTLKGRKISEDNKINYIKDARKTCICEDFYTNNLRIKFEGVLIY